MLLLLALMECPLPVMAECFETSDPFYVDAQFPPVNTKA